MSAFGVDMGEISKASKPGPTKGEFAANVAGGGLLGTAVASRGSAKKRLALGATGAAMSGASAVHRLRRTRKTTVQKSAFGPQL